MVVNRNLVQENQITTALDDRQFELHYQPQIEIANGLVVGSEALLRWYRPSLGLLMPDIIIPLAEKSGTIIRLGRWVIREACRQLSEWKTTIYGSGRMSVNVSPLQLFESGFVEYVKSCLQEHDINSECIELEITESICLKDIDAVNATLRALHDLGIRIALDDFGARYASLLYLLKLPIDTIKIDREIIQEPNKKGQAIVQSICRLARDINVTTIAEGVESRDQVDFLSSVGCDLAQGRYFSAPLAKEEYASYIHHTRTLSTQTVIQ